MDLEEAMRFAVGVAREAGEMLLEGFYAKKEIVHKSSAVDLVTQYDTQAEALIVERIANVYPDHGLLGEEGAERAGNCRFRWIVDPIDGTTNFAHGFPFWCISIALYEGKRPLIGVVYDPTQDELFHTTAGKGAFVIDRNGRSTPLQVSTTTELRAALLATGFPYDSHTSDDDNTKELRAFLKSAQGIRRPGSGALDLCYVAAGRTDGYWEYQMQPWDVAAGLLILQEAGGTHTNMAGGESILQKQMGVLASNGRIHQQMLDTLSSVQ